MHALNPDQYHCGKPLLVTSQDVLNFLTEYGEGRIKRQGWAPYLPDVLNGKVVLDKDFFTPAANNPDGGKKEGSTPLSSPLAKKMKTILSTLQSRQHALLGISGEERIAENVVLRSLITTIVTDTPFAERRCEIII